jgi:hypothetical protein
MKSNEKNQIELDFERRLDVEIKETKSKLYSTLHKKKLNSLL